MHPFTQVLGDVASQYMVLAKYRKANLIESVLLGTQFSEVLYVEKKKIPQSQADRVSSSRQPIYSFFLKNMFYVFLFF